MEYTNGTQLAGEGSTSPPSTKATGRRDSWPSILGYAYCLFRASCLEHFCPLALTLLSPSHAATLWRSHWAPYHHGQFWHANPLPPERRT